MRLVDVKVTLDQDKIQRTTEVSPVAKIDSPPLE